ncbi:hypothetical protein CWI36_0760p0010 [Hamiltosporidium magnivora]|uniref:Uncharacterized protein n=2 Tax=Hamiltosporidium magnivora TaxID=148818 RepID=A0A4Q9LAV7_9MICR|nr:hypothetical protein CWI36_0760p0010 [Hamiltosporidium magnivora]
MKLKVRNIFLEKIISILARENYVGFQLQNRDNLSSVFVTLDPKNFRFMKFNSFFVKLCEKFRSKKYFFPKLLETFKTLETSPKTINSKGLLKQEKKFWISKSQFKRFEFNFFILSDLEIIIYKFTKKNNIGNPNEWVMIKNTIDFSD